MELPEVPLPEPAESVERFLAWCAPLIDADELAETEKATAEFLAGPAAALQEELRAYAADPAAGADSWLDDFWAYRYLGRRDRIALNANFFFLFREAEPADQLVRAGELTAAAVALKLRIDEGRVPPIVRRGRPTSSAQLPEVFSTTRIPGEPQDTVRVADTSARHVVVLRDGAMHSLDVLDADGLPYPAAAITEALRALPAEEGEGVGALTSGARAQWAADRARLDPTALEIVETALLFVCLEAGDPPGTQEACDRLLAGDAANRWFDKALSIVVFPGGRAGVNIEHCRLDGTTVLQAVEEILGPQEDRPTSTGTPAPQRIDFGGVARDRIAQARQEFAGYAAANATRCLTFGFGSTAIKALGVSPDAFVQMAYQLAHRRAKGLTGATYESIATREYAGGRTEAMRVVTPEVVAFADALTSGADRATRKATFAAAVRAHGARARDCQEGRAPEQHLWELARRAREEPAFLRSPGWLTMRDDYLSTSSAPSESIEFFGFGSTGERCIGVAYVLLPDRFHLYLSTPVSVAEQLERFADELARALDELRELA
ncbi:choline/carnitine O-acyltransferase [Pseudonocardia ailaonensis]|uniref:Choline/carnitine O-acyltransferase n=1 Tax=Pseudonocardia ailaonensis TaxID=367279 RepID=A0ABN2NLB0_9PSEU